MTSIYYGLAEQQLIDDTEMTRISTDNVGQKYHFCSRMGVKSKVRLAHRGDADMPLTDKEISTKFHSLADPILGASIANEIEALSSQFDTLCKRI